MICGWEEDRGAVAVGGKVEGGAEGAAGLRLCLMKRARAAAAATAAAANAAALGIASACVNAALLAPAFQSLPLAAAAAITLQSRVAPRLADTLLQP